VAVGLRIVSYSASGSQYAEGMRRLAPDVVMVREGPRHLRWRTKSAHLASRLGLVYAAGGLPSLGNLVLVSLRVAVRDTWCMRFPLTPGRRMRGAVFARCSVAGTSFVVAGAHLSSDPDDRPSQAATLHAAILATMASDMDEPLILAADASDTALAQGLVDAVPGVILVSDGVRVTASHRPRHLGTLHDLPVAADISRPDAGRPDAGRPHAGRPHAGRPHAGLPDAGPPRVDDQGPMVLG
jgi:hypothetical protein